MEKGADRLISELYKKSRIVAMLAPSFVAQFDYPQIITQLKEFGIDKVVELTFGAKMVNREYHRLLKGAKKLMISSACPGIVETIRHKLPEFRDNLMPVDSPMIAMAKICKKFYPHHLTLFISPCIFKKIEAMQSEYVDIVIGYNELEKLLEQHNILVEAGNAAVDDLGQRRLHPRNVAPQPVFHRVVIHLRNERRNAVDHFGHHVAVRPHRGNI